MKETVLFILIFISLKLSAQTDSTVYKNLETKKFYSVSYSSESNGKKKTFKVNGKRVSQPTYEKYHSSWENMKTCRPCILESYDENDKLLHRGVSYTDCGVGKFEEFHPNGKIKVAGQYKENPTGDWNNVSARDYCSVAVGEWRYFDKNGELLYSEFWEDGKLIRQTPEEKD